MRCACVGVVLFAAAIEAGCNASPADEHGSAATLENATVSDVAPGHAPTSAFVPPTPAGCGAATAYDFCFAFDHGTPLEVRVALPELTRDHAVGVVRFHAADGKAAALVVQHVEFTVGARKELRLYFQVYPGSYRIAVGVDLDGDGNPEGPGDALGWSASSPDGAILSENAAALVDVGGTPIATSFTLALAH